jgi:hypothetical protein
MDEPFWGSSVPVRTFTKVVGVPLGVCVGLAAAGVALGAAVAAAGVGVAAVVVVCPVALVYKGVKSCVSYSSHVHRETVYTRNELVMRGVQVLLSVNVGDERFQQIVQMFTEGRWLSQYVYLAYTQAWDGTALLYLVAQEAHDQFPDTQTHARVRAYSISACIPKYACSCMDGKQHAFATQYESFPAGAARGGGSVGAATQLTHRNGACEFALYRSPALTRHVGWK